MLAQPILGHCVKSTIVGNNWASEAAGLLEQQVIGKAIGTVLLRCQHFDLPESQLGGNCMIDMDVEVKSARQ